MSGFVRPHSINYPHVYYTFQAQDLHSNKSVEYRVEDFPRHRFEEGVQFMIQNFFEYEVMGRTRRIKSDRLAVQEISQFWKNILPKEFSIACFKENSDELVAMNVLEVSTVKDPKDESKFQSQNMNDIFGVMAYAQQQFNAFQHYNVEEYLIAYGLCVNTAYRGRGVATEMLNARRSMLKALGLKVTTTAFTGIGSQKAAAKAGYEENFVISYGDLHKISEDFYFPGITSTHFKTMSMKV